MSGLNNGGHDSVMLVAALVLVVGGAIFIAISVRMRSGRSGSTASSSWQPRGEPAPTVRRSLDLIMAGLSVGAAVIHLVAAPHHFEEIGDLAAGFLISAGFQAWWAVACLAGPSRRISVIGVIGNLVIVMAWLYTRTIGMPIGEFAGSAEPIGFPDGASVVFELLLVAGLVARWHGLDVALSRRAAARTVTSIAVVPLIGLVIVLTSLATLATATGLDHGASPGRVGGEHAAMH